MKYLIKDLRLPNSIIVVDKDSTIKTLIFTNELARAKLFKTEKSAKHFMELARTKECGVWSIIASK